MPKRKKPPPTRSKERRMQEKRVPLRKCIGCGEMIGKKGAFRIVRSKEGEVSFDPTGKKSGRGAYICRDEKCLSAVRSGKKLERALKCPIPAELYTSLKKELSED